ncbi:MAG: DUF1592 domain-containing protein [Myxococcales bacterium]
MQAPSPVTATARSLLASVLGLCLGACSGSVEGPLGPGADFSASTSAALLGRTGPRRLTNTEYDNTVRDLLGTELNVAANFVAEEAGGFDNVAQALGMTPSQYESYFNAAETLSHELFADTARRAQVVSCSPTGSDGGPCLEQWLSEFGGRVFRRPLAAEEKASLKQAFGRALALGEAPMASVEHVLVAMLSSPQFLYRIETGADVQAVVSARERSTNAGTSAGEQGAANDGRVLLDSYALASRLSYFLWSTMPDAALFAKAEDGSLMDPVVLRAELARMLDDPRAGSLLDNFAAQWLSWRELAQHKVLAARYPEFDDALRDSMLKEARAYVSEFLFEDRPLKDFLRAQLNFVDRRLSQLYQLDLALPSSEELVRVEAGGSACEPGVDNPNGDRRGYLGLAAFLTVSSFAQRTSPTLRAKWVLEELMCSVVPPPPPNVTAQLEDTANAAASIENVRERLELHRSDPGCASCHARLDPIGLGLESFDAIGRSRTHYENGDSIDTLGELPDGRTFDGPVELSAILADDPRFEPCVARKLLTYALGRTLGSEPDLVAHTVASYKPQGTLRAMIESIVLGDAFRYQAQSTQAEPPARNAGSAP